MLTAFVVAAAALCLWWALDRLSSMPSWHAAVPVAAAALMAVGNGCSVPIRIRTQQRISVTSAGLLVLAAILPAPWVVVCTAAGVVVAKAVTRYPVSGRVQKGFFNTAKEIIGAAAVAGVVHLFGVSPLLQEPALVVGTWQDYLPVLVVGALTYAVVEEVLVGAAVSLATGQSWLRVTRRDLDIRAIGRLCGLVIAAVTLALLRMSPQMIVALPAASLVLYLAHVHRLHVRAERQVWTRLAAATGALAAATATQKALPDVLSVGVRRARALFGVPAEVELWGAGLAQLVRSSADTDDSSALSPAGAPQGHAICVLSRTSGESMGVLRLSLAGRDTLTPREHDLLRVYGVALANAIAHVDTYTGLSAQAEAAQRQASSDPLTGLANRRGLLEATTEWLAGGVFPARPALLLLDLDGFKQVNDTLGHPAGDQLLTAVADRLHRATLAVGAVAARLGGDEFGVLLTVPGPGLPAITRAEAIMACLAEPIRLEGVDGDGVYARGSAGLAVADPGIDFRELLSRADRAMYQAKRGRRPIVLYTPSMAIDADGRPDALVADLSRAVDAREVAVRAQPIVDLGSGRVVACEVLPDWAHPQHGVVQVPVWAELVERSPNAVQVCAYLVDKAVAAAARWRRAGLDVPVVVTVSPRCLLDQHFGHLVLGALRVHGVEPDQLVLAFSEVTGVSEAEVVDRVARLLRREGVRLAVDDFGAGPNSLAAPRRLQLDQLLIHAGVDPTSIVAMAAVRLGNDQRFVVTARGVRTEQQRRQWWEAGCYRGQGELFCRPLPVDHMIELVQQQPDHCLAAPLPAPEGVTVLHAGNTRPTDDSVPSRRAAG